MPEVEGESPMYEITIGTQRYGEATQEELDAYAPKTIIEP